ncbi:LEAF RUST 10 DISEASE-RESISTANCE LOCUS RECEPTOR-LIKE PROTEIN KINASE-like 1.1 [Jatropha curcas]|uniref:LEAF RUST 10 DISEASE-RESISTANCE LOCUS RECEPTOR-LIKE PROTEIN KINASE-like 1.1 n=1 Tax=Jatropha curcas TaxID=180498 RepID=UPI0009D67F49|nr:LEAF RUST 10 DISEASE-RESISTANCE LOCUS RECEPTOR-LIKE PROTEIN KINASE-like 1.1 [Jatropha curcas]
MMAALSFIVLLFGIFHSVFPFPDEGCTAISCGQQRELNFPFTNKISPYWCGPFVVDGCEREIQTIQLSRGSGKWYEIKNISQTYFINYISITDTELQEDLNSRNCESFNWSFPHLPFASFPLIPNLITLYKCEPSVSSPNPDFDFSNYTECSNFTIFYSNNVTASSRPSRPHPMPECSILQLPLNTENTHHDNIFKMLSANFFLQANIDHECYWCVLEGGNCVHNHNGEFECTGFSGPNIDSESEAKKKKGLGFKLGLGLGFTAILIMLVLIFLFRHRYYRKDTSSNLLLANYSSHLSSKSDLEKSNLYFGVSIFTYTELEEATNNFASENELGDGGFGTVYYGKLVDGREVAVKRLYERKNRSVQQFQNEIEILTRLHHKNLVSLYGCTSRHSRELVLVYEYISNGTVSDHLHGDQAKSSPLNWTVRMRIAIETASALVYLHASDVIHRDVKTNNILLDNNLCVKVADFGLSRLFPNDVTHVSTAPQGTPGYVDPAYHLCYQLTNKSDVYSFGVVLIELLSSMPAVDISRHQLEINLANLAITKIQQGAFDELIDKSFGCNSNEKVKRMTILVAELAFRCLQLDKEMRPTMDEVLEELKRIQSIEEVVKDDDHKTLRNVLPPPSPPADSDDESPLKNILFSPSPDTVTAKWTSSCSTRPCISG